MLKTRAIENVLISTQSPTQDGQIAQALMEEIKKQKNQVAGKIPVFPNGRSVTLHSPRSNTSLSPSPSLTGLNNTLGQGIITAQIGSQSNEIMKMQDVHRRFASVSPHRSNKASFQQVLSSRVARASTKLQKWDQMAAKVTELSEQRIKLAREKEASIEKKLESAQKHKE